MVHEGVQESVRRGRPRDLTNVTDEELDEIVRIVVVDFPDIGRRMLQGRLKVHGVRATRERILQSVHRIRGPSPNSFATPTYRRDKYSVPGPNALWHHDGQHGE